MKGSRAPRGRGAARAAPVRQQFQTDDRRFRLLVESIADYAVFMLDADGIVRTWNPGAERMKGYKAAEIVGSPYYRFFTPEDRAAGKPERALAQARSGGVFQDEGWRMRKDGSRFRASATLHAIHDEHGTFIGFAKVTRDVTQRWQTQQALIESERRFRLLVKAVTDYAIVMLDRDGRVANWNAGAERIKGYKADEIVGRSFKAFYTEEDIESGEPERALEIAAREGKYETEALRVRKDGSHFWANVVIDPIRDDDGTLVGFAKITRDISQRVAAQQELEQTRAALFQSQKMEAVGQLTGGLAHDFNNLLTVVIGNLERIMSVAGETDEVRRLARIATRAAERGARLTEHLLAFSRRQLLQPRRIDVNRAIHAFLPIMMGACGEPFMIEERFAADAPELCVDRAGFEATLLNLVLNARDALPGGGTIVIETAGCTIDEAAAKRLEIGPGSYARLRVIDQGTGMTEEVCAHAFEPFFTTKDVGAGSGLGLSQVYGFVRQSGGHAELRSAPGKGTTVELLLPAAPAQA